MSDAKELGQFIPAHYHGQMLSDQARMAGFRAAVNYVVKPGSTVLELGSGTGVLSYFAAQNAAKVLAVEFNPDLVEQARRILPLNRNGERVEVINSDAFEYTPPEPVDVVICEMLHVGLLREKQMEVIDAFKRRYRRRFADKPLPVFIPEAVIQAVQPVHYDFHFEGYYAPVSMFQDPYSFQPRTTELGEPVIYHRIMYEEPFDNFCRWSGEISAAVDGTLNALRIITKNILAFLTESESAIEWYNQYLVLPLGREYQLRAGSRIAVSIDYPAGAPLSALQPVVTVPD